MPYNLVSAWILRRSGDEEAFRERDEADNQYIGPHRLTFGVISRLLPTGRSQFNSRKRVAFTSRFHLKPQAKISTLGFALTASIDGERQALFLAGKVFTQYRKLGGSRTGVLPDFLIGASCGGQRVAAAHP